MCGHLERKMYYPIRRWDGHGWTDQEYCLHKYCQPIHVDDEPYTDELPIEFGNPRLKAHLIGVWWRRTQ